MIRYGDGCAWIRWVSPAAVLAAVAGVLFSIGCLCLLLGCAIAVSPDGAIDAIGGALSDGGKWASAAAVAAAVAALVAKCRQRPGKEIARQVRKRLFKPSNGNPLGMRQGQELPRVVAEDRDGPPMEVSVEASSVDVDRLSAVASAISSGLRGRYRNWAVTQCWQDEAFGDVTFIVDDVKVDRRIVARDVDDLIDDECPLRLRVQKGTEIDLRRSGSMLLAGVTRSGKTTGLISLMLQVLRAGPDRWGSSVLIVDPKRAELSTLPGVVSPDEDGGARAILGAMRGFAESMDRRQRHLDELARESGKAAMWWEAGMRPSFLVLDEYMVLKTLLPARPPKDEPKYCAAEFEGLLRKIVTMGRSAGMFVVISIAQASVNEGGLQSFVKAACTTRFLFKPDKNEASFLWKAESMPVASKSKFGPGDAWFSSEDGEHEMVSVVRFPKMEFGEYGELGSALRRYRELGEGAGVGKDPRPHI